MGHRPFVPINLPVGHKEEVFIEQLSVDPFQRQSLLASLSDESEDSIGCTHLTHLAIFGSSTIPVPLRPVSGITLSIWLLWELRRLEGLPLVGDPAFARIKRLVCSRSPVRFLLPLR